MREVRSWGIGELEVDPVLWGYSPNKKLQREATHTGDAQYAEVKLVPSRTSLSKAGVWIIGLPRAEIVSNRCWSVIIANMLGFFI
tara:strand:- start:288 stop:542 length:255 start_codon:yes stop_codon:yes gene_type:complete